MMLKRKIEKDIMHWIDSSDKALLIYGVRQAGKTFIVRECLKAAGCEYIEFNLIRQPEIVGILDGATSVNDLILKLSLYSDIPRNTTICMRATSSSTRPRRRRLMILR